jgi:hypothetical protein
VREGWGITRLDSTLSFPGSNRELWAQDVRNTHSAALQTGQQEEYVVEVLDGEQPLKVTLVWTDTPSDDGCIVNNLDLEVTSPGGGTTFFGNQSAILSTAACPAAKRNNVEQVLVSAPAVGEWTLRVKGTEIAFTEGGLQGQGYALVATAASLQEP